MAVGYYRYYDDGGRVFGVALPSEFASALSYEAADGSETYLPQSISPRYATYVAPQSGLFRQVVVPRRETFIAPPNPVAADGETWNLVSLFGETFMLLPGGNVQVIAGPQGPKGDDGAPGNLTFGSAVLGADMLLQNNTETTILTINGPATGTYLVTATVTVQQAATAGIIDLMLRSNHDLPIRPRSNVQAASQYVICTLTALLVDNQAPAQFWLSGRPSINNTRIVALNPDGSLVPATRLDWIKLA